MTREEVGQRIRAIRKRKNLTQANMATELGLTHSAYSKIERTLKTSVERLFQISQILDVDITRFFTDELMQTADGQPGYGFATKDDVAEVKRSLESLFLKEIDKLRQDLMPKKSSKTRKYGSPDEEAD